MITNPIRPPRRAHSRTVVDSAIAAPGRPSAPFPAPPRVRGGPFRPATLLLCAAVAAGTGAREADAAPSRSLTHDTVSPRPNFDFDPKRPARQPLADADLQTAQKWCLQIVTSVAVDRAGSRTMSPDDVTVMGDGGEYTCREVIDEYRLRGL